MNEDVLPADLIFLAEKVLDFQHAEVVSHFLDSSFSISLPFMECDWDPLNEIEDALLLVGALPEETTVTLTHSRIHGDWVCNIYPSKNGCHQAETMARAITLAMLRHFEKEVTP